MSTRSTFRAMAAGSWRRKIATRLESPALVAADLRRLGRQMRGDLVGIYARYHERRKTPLRLCRIPGRGCRMWLPVGTGLSVAERRFGLFEPETFDALDRLVAPGAVVVEVGACYGEFTIHLSRLVGREGRVHSFELFPPYFEIATKNVALNGLTNVSLQNRAVGRSGAPPIQVNTDAGNPYGALDQISQLDYSVRTGKDAAARAGTASIDVVSLRTFIQGSNRVPDLLFMDIEGCELEVLADLQPLLRGEGKRPTVYFELHKAFYGQAGLDWLDRLFADSGYACERVAGHLLCRPVRAAGGVPLPAFAGTAGSSAASRAL